LIAVALCLSAVSRWAVCAPLLDGYDARYEVRSGRLKVGTMTRRLTRQDGQGYRFESRMESSGLFALVANGHIEETSEGHLTADALQPRFYAYRRLTRKKPRETEIEFDWNSGRISTTAQGQRWQMAAVPGTLDKLVYQLALMRDLERGTQELRYQVADGGRLKAYQLERAGEETLEILGQSVPTVKVMYTRQGSQRRTVLWCAPNFDYLPVRIEYRERDGRTTTATLLELQRASVSSPRTSE
jgi:hypothetical protein